MLIVRKDFFIISNKTTMQNVTITEKTLKK